MVNDEVIVIGCGIIGLTIGFQLASSGIKVTCIDKSSIGSGGSSAALGYVSPPPNHEVHEQFTNLAIRSLHLFEEFISNLRNITQKDYEVNQNGYLHLIFSEDEKPTLRQMYKSWVRAGLNILPLTRDETLEIEPLVSSKIIQSLLMEDAISVNPQELMTGLANGIKKLGSKILENTEIIGLLLKNNNCEGVLVGNDALKTKYIVVSTGSWTSSLTENIIKQRVKPIKGQVVILKAHTQPYLSRPISTNYGVDILPRRNGDVWVGTSNEDIGFDIHPNASVAIDMLSKAFDVVPALEKYGIIGSRAGLRPYSQAGLPIIGPHPKYHNLIFATGHYQDGVLLAPITSLLIEEYILGGNLSHLIDDFIPIDNVTS